MTAPAAFVDRVHRLVIRVYYEDTDAAGIVYHANYLKFAERGRTELLRQLGFGQEEMRRTTGLAFAVRHCAADYLRPAVLDDELTVATHLLELRGASLAMEQRIERAGQTLAGLTLRLACIGPAGRPARLPDALRAALAPLAPAPFASTLPGNP